MKGMKGVSALLLSLNLINALPQYHVFVDPPIRVPINGAIPQGTTDVQVTLCFREIDSSNSSLDYCPLGRTTLPAPNGPDTPPQFLEFGDGADLISPTYPVIRRSNGHIQGFGLIVNVSGVSSGDRISLGSYPFLRIGGEPGETVNTGIILGGFKAFVGADCLPEFTGRRCHKPAVTTSPPVEATTTKILVTTPAEHQEDPTTETTTTTQELTTYQESVATSATIQEPTTDQESVVSTSTQELTTDEESAEPTTVITSATTEEPTTAATHHEATLKGTGDVYVTTEETPTVAVNSEGLTLKVPTTESSTTEELATSTQEPDTDWLTTHIVEKRTTTEIPVSSATPAEETTQVGGQMSDVGGRVGAVVGGILAAAALITLVIVVLLVICRKRKPRSYTPGDNMGLEPLYQEIGDAPREPMNGREEAVVPHATSEVILSLSEMTKEGHLFPQEYQEPTKLENAVQPSKPEADSQVVAPVDGHSLSDNVVS